MKNLGNQILAELKPNYKQCVNCGKMIRIKSNKDHSTIYCEECAKEKQLESDRNYRKKIREVEKCR